MADHIPPGDVNLYQHMAELEREVVEQKTQCCWATAVGAAVGYTYGISEREREFEVSAQDIFDKVWYYSSKNDKYARRVRRQDQRGGFLCRNSIAFEYVNKKGARLERDCPFENILNRNSGPVLNTEIPRVYCTPYERLDLEGAVNSILNDHVAVTAAVDATDAFRTYGEQGVYRKPPGALSSGTHSVVIVGVNVEERYFRILNSWGVGWGYGGYGLVHFDSISRFGRASSAWIEHYARAN